MKKKFSTILKRMYFLEILGEEFYGALFNKCQDKDLKSIFGQLTQTEKDMSILIGAELKKSSGRALGIFGAVAISIAKGFFVVSSQKILLSLAKSVLGKKNYRNWQNICQDEGDACFWQALLDHENEQLRLLGPYFK